MLSCFSYVQLFVTPWTVAHHISLSTGFFRQEYWSGLPCCSPGDLPDPGIEPTSLMFPALAGEFFTAKPPGKLWYVVLVLLSCFSRVHLCATSWTVAHHISLSMGFSWQEYWNRLPCPLPVDLPNPRIEPAFLRSLALVDGFFTISAIW